MSLGTLSWQDVTIANGAALSSAMTLRGRKLVAIQQDASCEGTAWGLVASHDGVTYVAVYNVIQEATGAAPVSALWEVTKSATVAQCLFLPDAFRVYGFPYIKIQSENGSNAASNQTGAQTVRLFYEEVQNGSP